MQSTVNIRSKVPHASQLEILDAGEGGTERVGPGGGQLAEVFVVGFDALLAAHVDDRLPYLCPPICRNDVSSVASMKLPSG